MKSAIFLFLLIIIYITFLLSFFLFLHPTSFLLPYFLSFLTLCILFLFLISFFLTFFSFFLYFFLPFCIILVLWQALYSARWSSFESADFIIGTYLSIRKSAVLQSNYLQISASLFLYLGLGNLALIYTIRVFMF